MHDIVNAQRKYDSSRLSREKVLGENFEGPFKSIDLKTIMR